MKTKSINFKEEKETMAKILIVDDEKNQRLLYQEEFEEQGFEVHTAENGSEALRMVDQIKPNLVVLDISMPGMDGIEALSGILAKHPKLPVILHTAYSSYKDNFMSWSAHAYVVKSSDRSELFATVRKLLQDQEKEVEKAAE